jgi:hypothetical protein
MSDILIVSFSPIERDPRVLRQVRELRSKHRLTVAGFGPFSLDGVEGLSLRMPVRTYNDKARIASALAARRFEHFYWRQQPQVDQLIRLIGNRRFDLILANDFDTLPVAFRLARGAPVVADLHEYALDESRHPTARLFWSPLKRWVLSHHLHLASGVSTVADGIAAAYCRQLGIPRPIVIPNAPPFVALSPSSETGDRVRLVHHGSCGPNRGLEDVLRVVGPLDERFELHLMLVGDDGPYGDHLRRLAAANGRTTFHQPVPTFDISLAINGYDLGIHLLPGRAFNDLHALPNKFFEFVQARLGVIVGPSPEMAGLITQHGLGLAAPSRDPRQVAALLNRLTADEIQSFKRASHAAAPELCWEAFAPRLHELVDTALARG